MLAFLLHMRYIVCICCVNKQRKRERNIRNIPFLWVDSFKGIHSLLFLQFFYRIAPAIDKHSY